MLTPHFQKYGNLVCTSYIQNLSFGLYYYFFLGLYFKLIWLNFLENLFLIIGDEQDFFFKKN